MGSTLPPPKSMTEVKKVYLSLLTVWEPSLADGLVLLSPTSGFPPRFRVTAHIVDISPEKQEEGEG